MVPEDQERERLYRQSLAGDRARVCLEEAGRFLEARKAVLMTALQAADSLEKAYVVACEYRALTGFVKMLEADVVVGTAAAQKLLEE